MQKIFLEIISGNKETMLKKIIEFLHTLKVIEFINHFQYARSFIKVGHVINNELYEKYLPIYLPFIIIHYCY